MGHLVPLDLLWQNMWTQLQVQDQGGAGGGGLGGRGVQLCRQGGEEVLSTGEVYCQHEHIGKVSFNYCLGGCCQTSRPYLPSIFCLIIIENTSLDPCPLGVRKLGVREEIFQKKKSLQYIEEIREGLKKKFFLHPSPIYRNSYFLVFSSKSYSSSVT